jgi:hypothetical protein
MKLALPVLLGLVLATPAAAAPSFVIHSDTRIGTYAVQADGSLAGVIRAFGEPARLRRTVEGCSGVWPTYGLTVDVYNLGGKDPCTPRYGRFDKAVMHGSLWRTAVGLRIGMSNAAVRRYYPRATFHRGMRHYWPSGWWLVRRVAIAGGPFAYPGLLAETRGGKVVAFQVRYPAGGD